MINNTPLFSVLIAQYNNGQYLQEAIDSVKAQTYTNWEIIIVDDDSTDNSKELYQLYEQDDKIKIYYNEENKGCGYTKRRCIELANGEICGFLDPDDALLPDALESCVNVYLKDENISVTFSRHYLCDKQMNIFDESRILRIPEGLDYFTFRDFRAEHFVTFKKQCYDKTQGLNALYKAGVDADLNFILEEAGSLYVMDNLTYKHRKSIKNAITADYSKSQFWNILVQYDTCKRRGLDIEKYVYDFYLKSVHYTSNEAIQQAEDKVRNTKAYKIGNAILKPFKFFKSLCCLF